MPRRSWFLALPVVGALLAAAVLAGCGSSSAAYSTGTPGLAQGPINEANGIYRGVHLGMSINDAGTVLGSPLTTNNDTYLDPAQMPPFLPADSPYDWVYPDETITFVEAHVASMVVYGRGAATLRGIGLGDRLSSVSRAYPTARCIAGRGGGEPENPGCQIHMAPHVYVYFSGNPIQDIALSEQTVIP